MAYKHSDEVGLSVITASAVSVVLPQAITYKVCLSRDASPTSDSDFAFGFEVCYNSACFDASVSFSGSIDSGINSDLIAETAETIYEDIIGLGGKALGDAEEEFTKGFDDAKDALTGAAANLFDDLGDIAKSQGRHRKMWASQRTRCR